jgi:bisphosphoglycerate-independent phosphoglycerate mutase (AlkP superfamily)
LQRVTWDTPAMAPGVIYDSFAMHAAFHHVKKEKPRVAFIGFGETDEWAHHNRYDEYLKAAHRVDGFVREFWTMLQSMSEYRGKTTLIITADHGRGTGLSDWKHHNAKLPDSAANWIAVLGPDTPPLGERANIPERSVNQLASTMAALLGMDYQTFFSQAGAPLQDVIAGR